MNIKRSWKYRYDIYVRLTRPLVLLYYRFYSFYCDCLHNLRGGERLYETRIIVARDIRALEYRLWSMELKGWQSYGGIIIDKSSTPIYDLPPPTNPDKIKIKPRKLEGSTYYMQIRRRK